MELRQAVAEDAELIFDLHRAIVRERVIRTSGEWDDAWQRRRFQDRFRPETCRIVVHEGREVGVLDVERRAEDFFVRFIEILPAYQGRGIGTRLLRAVMAEAGREGRSVSLLVRRDSPAVRLYRRLGLRTVGETATHYLMQSPRVSDFPADAGE